MSTIRIRYNKEYEFECNADIRTAHNWYILHNYLHIQWTKDGEIHRFEPNVMCVCPDKPSLVEVYDNDYDDDEEAEGIIDAWGTQPTDFVATDKVNTKFADEINDDEGNEIYMEGEHLRIVKNLEDQIKELRKQVEEKDEDCKELIKALQLVLKNRVNG